MTTQSMLLNTLKEIKSALEDGSWLKKDILKIAKKAIAIAEGKQ